MSLPSIMEAFECDPECPTCLGEGHVCEAHPDRPWAGTVAPPVGCDCGAPGMPCRDRSSRLRRHDITLEVR